MRAILTYHSIDDSGSVISVDPEMFRRHVEWLSSGAVRVVPLARIEEPAEDDDAVALTFDDAFENFASRAWPLLSDHGLPATVFVVADRAGGTNDWEDATESGIPEMPLLEWDALGRLAEEDGVTIGSHGRTHCRLARLPEPQLSDEIEGSRAIIQDRCGAEADCFAYPYGAVDAPAREVAARAYGLAVGTRLGRLRPADDRFRLPRLDAYYYRTRGRLESWGTPAFAGHLWMRGRARELRAAMTGMKGVG